MEAYPSQERGVTGIQSSDRGRLEKVESVTRLHAGIKKDEEEEFFESEVSV